ncbi:PLP-dependent cysteine synthase family protein [Saccharopolyspora dendranthemae]|uniref:L-cysteine desulfhydrase Cds1 n=1 Tax=Saccharopolyspora dendranthemae TaxID=1181886 RepID=A0A561U6D9_9PSEU|nr:PLP-dependent cysteine synthase family protein [Saccharopolyspora dendranthemae]TWF94938.1 cysteine synthase A [Saccharopolyspora dendranthemae]
MTSDVDRSCERTRAWTSEAVRIIEADANRSADTHLLRYPLPAEWGIDLYLKDESTHPTGSLKHRLARSLFLYAICNGWVTENTPVIEASSGSTAVSEAYFARLLGLPFIAVMPRSTSGEKVALIEWQGGRCHFVDEPGAIYTESRRLAAELGGHFMDQFTNAERATDWRGNNNIAESIFEQLALEPHPEPAWIVVGAGTGGTSATIGRYVRYRRLGTRLAVVDPQRSVFFEAWRDHDLSLTSGSGSLIEGIGRPRVEPSFIGEAIDRMIKVPDAASIATIRCTEQVLGRRVGGSTGTNLWGVFELVSQMLAEGRTGSIVTLLCDGGERYTNTYFDDRWVREQGMDLDAPLKVLDHFHATGEFQAG